MAAGELRRRLGTGDAIVLGLASMIGAGVFAVFGPAARVAGTGLLVGLAIAALIAYANAAASAQLAAVHPTSGGTYVFGRERLGEWWGFTAGWAFVVGKTASCAAMALTFAAYVVPAAGWTQRLVALAAVLALGATNYRGITRTARLSRILVAVTLASLGTVLIGSWLAPGPLQPLAWSVPGGAYGVLQAAGLLFFAFAGYARIATLGEEVTNPRRTIPRAIIGALAVVVVLYAAVGWTALAAAGPQRLAASNAPLTDAVLAAGASWLVPVVQVGAAVASLGALLSLLAGVGRTMLAMARNGDLPTGLAAVHPEFATPHRAELLQTAVVAVAVVAGDLTWAIGFSSFGVLVYYAIANASAFTQPAADRRWPRWVNVAGAAGCLTLAATLPLSSMLTGAAVIAVGLIGRIAKVSTIKL
jgi:APA family basic amino acid/polyamine antiporter